MGLFSRPPRSVLPDNIAELLTDWGRREFDRAAQPDIREDTSEFIGSIEYRRPPEELRLRLIEGIREVGVREGGWTVYGAWDVVVAFLDPVPQEILDELLEARVRFLLSLEHSNLYNHLNSEDLIMIQRLDPDEYARLSPV